MRNAALFFTVCSLLAAAAAPAQAADAASLVSIRMSPAVPVEGKPVDLFAISAGGYDTYTWDLDGDEVYDDATGATTRQILPPGTHTISARATDELGRTSTETRSITAVSRSVRPTTWLSVTPVVEVDRPLTVAAFGRDDDGSITKFEFDLDGDGVYEISRTPSFDWWWQQRETVTFDTPGDRVVRVRATDDEGQTAVATSSVHVTESDPWATMSVHGDLFDAAPIAGEPTTISAGSGRPGVKYEFDLDGDGTYELDKGATAEFTTTLSAGTHVIGARITDRRGNVVEPRITTVVYEPTDEFVARVFVRRFEAQATAGEPTDLTAYVEPYTRAYKVEWDADGDGDFDDGTSTTPGGTAYESSIAHTTFTYPSPGVYEQRARVSYPGLPTRVFTARIFVGTAMVGWPGIASLNLVGSPLAGVPYRIEAVANRVNGGTADAAWDLDGDEQFDESPSYHDWAYWWTV